MSTASQSATPTPHQQPGLCTTSIKQLFAELPPATNAPPRSLLWEASLEENCAAYKAAYVASENARFQAARDRWNHVEEYAQAIVLEYQNQAMRALQQLTLDFRSTVMKREVKMWKFEVEYARPADVTNDVMIDAFDFQRLAGHLFIRGLHEHGDPGYRATLISTDPEPDAQQMRGEPLYFLGIYVFWNPEKSVLEQRVEEKLAALAKSKEEDA